MRTSLASNSAAAASSLSASSIISPASCGLSASLIIGPAWCGSTPAAWRNARAANTHERNAARMRFSFGDARAFFHAARASSMAVVATLRRITACACALITGFTVSRSAVDVLSLLFRCGVHAKHERDREAVKLGIRRLCNDLVDDLVLGMSPDPVGDRLAEVLTFTRFRCREHLQTKAVVHKMTTLSRAARRTR